MRTIVAAGKSTGDDHFISLLRPHTLQMFSGAAKHMSQHYSHDNASRLTLVREGELSASHTCLPSSPLVGQVAFNDATTSVLITTKQYDHLNRSLTIGSAAMGSTPSPIFFATPPVPW